MAEALEDLSVVRSHSSSAPRKRARQDSACTMEDNLVLVNGGDGNGSSSNHSPDDGVDGNNRESGRHKRQRGESHEDVILPRTSGQWPLSTPSRSRSLSPASNATQSSEHSESTVFSPDDFIPLPTSLSQEDSHEPQRAVNETNYAEDDIARSMEFDQQMDILRRSPNSLASQSGLSRLSSTQENQESSQTQESITTLDDYPEEPSNYTREEGAPHRDARSELVPRLLRRMRLRSNGSSGINLPSVGTMEDMGGSSSSSFRPGSVNRPPNPIPDSRLRVLHNVESAPTSNPWIPYEHERQTLPSLLQTNSPSLAPRDRTQLPSLSHAIHSRNGPRDPFLNQDPIVTSSRAGIIARPDPPPPSSRHNPAPLRSSDWFQDMHDLFHPYTPFGFDDHNGPADSGRESPLFISDLTQSRRSPEGQAHDGISTNSSQQMASTERTWPSLSSLRDRPNDSLHVNARSEDNVLSARLQDPPSTNISSLRRSVSDHNGARAFSPMPWRNFLAGLDSRESSLENLTTAPPPNAVPERRQTNTQGQGQSISLVGTLRDLLHRSTSTQGDPTPNRRRVRNPFRSFERTRSASLDTEERIMGLIDDDFPVLSVAPPPTATTNRPSRSLLDPALRFNSTHSSAPSSGEQVHPSQGRLIRHLRSSWDMDDEQFLQEPEPFIPEPVRNERIDPPRPRSFASIFGLNRSPPTAPSNPGANDRIEPPWSHLYRNNISEPRSTVHPHQYLPSRYLRGPSTSTIGERPDVIDIDQDSDRTVSLPAFSVSGREPVRSPPHSHRQTSPIHAPSEPVAAPESYLSRIQRQLRRLPTINSQRSGPQGPPLSESNVRTNNSAGSPLGSPQPWVPHEITNEPHRYSVYNSRPLSPDFLFTRRAQSTSDNAARPNLPPHPNSRFIPSLTSRENTYIGEATQNLSSEVSSVGGDPNRPWRIPPVRNGESFNDLVRRRVARADANREIQSRINSQRGSTMPEMGLVGQRSNLERTERLNRLERLRNSLDRNSFDTTATGGETLRPDRERLSHDQISFLPRLGTNRPPPSRSNSEVWSTDTSHWNDLPRLSTLGRTPPLGQSTPPEPQGPLLANPVAPRAFTDQGGTSAEDDSSASASRERQQLRDVISRRIRDEELGPRGFLSRYVRSSTQSDQFAPLADATARMQRYLRESEAEVDRALRALDQWGELEQRDLEPSQSYMHRFGERRRHSSLFNATNSASDWDAAGFSSFQTQQDHRPQRRSPSPTTLGVRQQVRQARWIRAQNRYRESSDLFGERRRSRFELRGHFPRILGDYIADEDFDSSYETLLQLSSLIGDVKPRGTAPHLLARMPTGFYKDFTEPDGETRCPICLDDYKDLDPVLRISDCNHWFHKGCLEQWLQTARTCPLCKTVVKGRQLGKKPADNAPGPSRRDDDSDDDDPRHDSREDSPSLTLEELGSYAAGW